MTKRISFALLVAVLLAGALQSFNFAVMRVANGDLWAAWWPLVRSAGWLGAAMFAWFSSARADREVTPRLLATTLLGLTTIGYAAFLLFVPVHRLGTAVTEPPLATIEENQPRRGRHTYRTNSLGFRGPEWSVAKSSGTVRGAVVGDSMVFGSGVDDDDTIAATLARRLQRTHPAAPVEVLDLGVEGTNLPGYVELYRAATERLDADFVVVMLFLPNDLGELEQPSQGDHPGLYSFFTFLLGTNDNPYTRYAMQASETRSDESKLAFLARHLDAIETIRASRHSAPLFVFIYHDDDPRWGETVRTKLGAGAWLVEHERLPDTEFIPGDGHPTPQGNAHFAELIGDAIDRSGSVFPARRDVP